jgi:hypothetical protein
LPFPVPLDIQGLKVSGTPRTLNQQAFKTP